MYNREEVFAATVEYFNGDELAANVWINKYCLKDSAGNLYEKTPADMHRRLAKELARIEANYPQPLSEEEIFELLKDFKYIVPAGSPMAGIGNQHQIMSISNCFVVGNTHEDSYGSILKTDQELVQLCKRRAGVGTTLEHIRPKGSSVKNAALTSTGVVPFMERYSNSIREVAQSGRRGALLIATHINSIDAEDFINAKVDLSKVTGANISVKIDDEFMQAAMSDKDYVQKFPIQSTNPEKTKTISARTLWQKLIHNNWSSAEPGILFWSTIKKESIPDCYADEGFESIATNPCGEIILCSEDSCRLTSINLFSYVKNPFTNKAEFDWDLFEKHVQIAERLMDDIVDLEIEKVDLILNKIQQDPESEETKRIELNLWQNIKRKAQQGRRTGLGVTGEGDMLAALNLKYGTKEATKFATQVHQTLAINAYRSSINMAKERGVFPIFNWDKEKENPFLNRLFEVEPDLRKEIQTHGRRNIALLTIAPNGSVSLLTQTTSGIENVFKPVYKRRKKVNPNDKNSRIDFIDEMGDTWEEYNVFHHKFKDWLEINGYNFSEVCNMEDVDLEEIIKESPYYKATSEDVDWVEKVKMQGQIQKWVDHSISVTVNLPAEATEEIVDQVYQTAWREGCKGITIYREGSRSGVLVAKSNKNKNKESNKTVNEILKESNAPRRPKNLECEIIRFRNKGEKWIAFVGILNGRPYEVFTGVEESFPVPKNINKAFIKKVKKKVEGEDEKRYDLIYKDKEGYEIIITGLSRAFNPQYWDYAKLISALLRHEMSIPKVINLLETLHLDGDLIGTWKQGVKRVLKKFIETGTKIENKCPKCNQDTLVFQDGCVQCMNKDCGYSAC
jgi:ribonucleoside-diphosphate reductase alpha chain